MYEFSIYLHSYQVLVMRSHTSSANLSRLGFLRPLKRSCFSTPSRSHISFDSSFSRTRNLNSYFDQELWRSSVRKYGCCSRHRLVQVTAMDEDSVASSLIEWVDNEEAVGYGFSSSEGEASDEEVILNPITDADLPSVRDNFRPTDDALTVTAHRLAIMGRARKKSRIKYGIFINMGLITFLTVLLILVDCCAWRIVRLPLSPFHLMRPFSTSAVLVACAGYIGVPILRRLKIQSIIRKEGPAKHSSKKGTPTMGGLFFVPIGIIVAEVIVGFSSIEVSGVAAATLAFAAIGLVDDFLSLIKNHNNGLSAWMRILLEAAVGAWFSFWLFTANVSSPYSMYTFL